MSARPRRFWLILGTALVVTAFLASAAVAALLRERLDFRPDLACCWTPEGGAAGTERPTIAGPLWNEGRVGVRITAIEGPPDTEVRMVGRNGWSDIADARPFAPFDLPPGDYRVIVVRATVPACRVGTRPAGGWRSSSAVRVRYTLLGVERATVLIGDEAGRIAFAEAADGRCDRLVRRP